jgi:hypothetical protein
MTLSRSLTKKFKHSIRSSSLFENEKPVQKPYRPIISLPLERPDFVQETEPLHVQAYAMLGYRSADYSLHSPSSSFSSSSARRSFSSSPATPRASSDSQTSFSSGDHYLPSVNEKKVSFSIDTAIIPRRTRPASVGSSIYAAEGELPPPMEDEEDISQRIGKFRFSAAEYIKEIEGTPLILVDGKLYL